MKHEIKIVARGEMSLLQSDVVIRYLGRQGLSAELSFPEEEGEIPLGTAQLGDFQQFELTDERYRDTKSNLGTRSFSGMSRAAHHAENGREYYRNFKGIVIDGQVNLDLVAKLIDEDKLTEIPNFGKKAEQFVGDFIDFRRQSLVIEPPQE